MAVIRCLPRVVATYDLWTLGAGASKVAAVQTDDGDTSYITDSGSNKKQSYFVDTVANRMQSVSTIDVAGKGRGTTTLTTPSTSAFIRGSATDTGVTTVPCGVSYALATASRGTNAVGGAWTPAILDATELGFFSQTPDDSPVFFITWGYFDVTGILIAGSFVFFAASLFGPIVALGLHELPRLARVMFQKTRIMIQPHEYEGIWREFRDARYAKHFFRPASGLYLPEVA